MSKHQKKEEGFRPRREIWRACVVCLVPLRRDRILDFEFGRLTREIRLLPLLLALLFCFACSRTTEEKPISAQLVPELSQEIENATLFLYDGPKKSWMLKAEHMRKNPGDTGKIFIYPVRLFLYDSAGRPAMRVFSDSGTTNNAKDRFSVWGNVYVKNQDSTIVKAEQLDWDKNRRKITSTRFVQIETNTGDVMRGKGLDATENFSSWSLRSNVSGQFPNFRERIEKDEPIGPGN
jgi:LPS export ABC transporter protein LptC